MKLNYNLSFLLFVLFIQGGVTCEMEQLDHTTEGTLSKLLSFKFSYGGSTLADKIEEFKKQEEFTRLSKQSIANVLERLKFASPNSSSANTLVLYVPTIENENVYKDHIVSSAYYPWELDSHSLLFSQTSDLEHIQIQLAYALHYGHPFAALELEKIATSYYLPRSHVFFQELKEHSVGPKNFDKFIFSIEPSKTNSYTVDQLDLSSMETDVQIEHFDKLTSIIQRGHDS